ncbi:MAG: prepilin-type N-terminal cleavage/methylation domain-containing protein [Phycisphaeraceae bacterium]|nr:prepilin-type N-terminal cleavage/methylation domain-containing protein [Phycisphaeraceae bacterium]
MKLIDLGEFINGVREWTVIPSSISYYVGVFIPFVEVVLGGSWFVVASRRRVELMCVLLVLVFTMVYAAESLFNAPPNCNCLGLITRWTRHNSIIHDALPRNVAIMALGAFGLFFHTNHKVCVVHSETTRDRDQGVSCRSAFTLIETLVVVGIVGIVASLVIPGLRHLHREARNVSALNATASHAQVFLAYTTDYAEQFPFLLNVGPGANTPVTIPTQPSTSWRVDSHFTQSIIWPVLMADEYYGGRFTGEDFRLYQSNAEGFSELLYSCSMLASPGFWNPRTRTGPEQWRSVRTGEVRYPSLKAVLFDDYSDDDRVWTAKTVYVTGKPRPICMGLADGSGRWVLPKQFGPSYVGLGSWPGYPPLHPPGSVLSPQFTLDGARGRDIID